MRRSLMLLIAIGLVCGLTGGASAHIGERVFLLFEATEDDLGDIDLRDGTVEDWEDVFGEPSWTPTDLYQDPTIGDGAQYDPADLDYRIWAGWSTSGHIWYAMDRIDNVYFGREYDGASPWNYDAIEIMIDGDHTGGDYTGSANPNWKTTRVSIRSNPVPKIKMNSFPSSRPGCRGFRTTRPRSMCWRKTACLARPC